MRFSRHEAGRTPRPRAARVREEPQLGLDFTPGCGYSNQPRKEDLDMNQELFEALDSKVAGLLEKFAALKEENALLTAENQRLVDEREALKSRVDAILGRLDGI